MEYSEKSAGNPFEKLLAEFVEKTGVKTDGAGPNSIDVIADGVMVSAQYRPDRGDCVIFTLPVEDLKPDGRMLRRALEIAADGEGTHGHFLGMREGMLVLSSVLKPVEISAEEFGIRLLDLAAASREVAAALQQAPEEKAPDVRGMDFMQV
ncbi:MAG: type III secretion system chaperone [Kiritimatiellae bacterium]|nr:type III secretion system chaperone [Kiritimatiellia bacterium]